MLIVFSILFFFFFFFDTTKRRPASVAQLDAPSDWRPGGRGFNPRRGRQNSFVEIDHEVFSTVILSFRWFKKGSCQFLAKECAQYWLTAKRTKPAQ